jgi:rhodanese-related sulfurtransferase
MKKWLIAIATLGLLGATACERSNSEEEDPAAEQAEEGTEANQQAQNTAGTQPSEEEEPSDDETGAQDDESEMTAQQAMDELPDVTPEQLSEMMESDATVVIYDANGEATRTEMGYVPDAVLLASTEDFPESELPDDKSTKLVFYCGGPSCMAAPRAAARAVNLGYEDVAVMRAGIKGWTDAEMTVAEYKPEDEEE